MVVNIGGYTGKGADWDEFTCSTPVRSKILLRGGITQTSDPAGDWRFDRGQQLLGLGEQDAIRAIGEELFRIRERQNHR